MQNRININLQLSRIGLGLIIGYCILASIFFSPFAQIHLPLSCLPFPIFVGEIVMLVCFAIMLWLVKDGRTFNKRTAVLLVLYFGWVGLRTLINYHYDGPLTCRNAALFYYPIFAVCAYCFYKKAKLHRDVLMSLILLAGVILLFKLMVLYFWWTYVSLFAIAVWNIKPVKWRWFGVLFLVGILILGKEYLYQGSRTHFVSVFGAVVFLAIYFGALLAKHRAYSALSVLLIIFILFFSGYSFFAEHHDVHSVTSIKSMISTYNEFEKQYLVQEAYYVPEKLPVQLYNPKKFSRIFHPASQKALQPSGPASVCSQQPITASRSAGTSKPIPKWLKNIVCNQIRADRSLDLDENNIVFRLLVWRDMARELIDKRAWWGFSFGHPQRSRSLEVLHWAQGEWSRDGWITPHNSFFHIVYRAGILGLCLIGILFFMIASLIKDFFKTNSVEGGILVGILVYWLVLSNFLVILEFPYNAILFWSLFGITWAYRENLLSKAVK